MAKTRTSIFDMLTGNVTTPTSATSTEKNSVSREISSNTLTSPELEEYARLRALAIKEGDAIMADAYQLLIDDEKERLVEEAKRKAEEAKAAAKAKAEEKKKKEAEAKAKAEFTAKAKAIEPLIEYFLATPERAEKLIEAIAAFDNGEKAIFSYHKP